jgi:hypothetical protein
MNIRSIGSLEREVGELMIKEIFKNPAMVKKLENRFGKTE